MNNEAIKKYSIITRRIELLPVWFIYFKIKKLPINAAAVQKAPKQILYPIINWPDKINIKEDAMAVTIIRKLLVELLCFGSMHKLEHAGIVIITPTIPNKDDTIPAKMPIPTT